MTDHGLLVLVEIVPLIYPKTGKHCVVSGNQQNNVVRHDSEKLMHVFHSKGFLAS